MRAGRPSVTARWIAAQRALLAPTRPSTPTGDIDAERRLYEGMSRALTLPGLRPTGLAERTRFMDTEVTRAIGNGVEQIVIVGAGYDGRALRFAGGSVHWFEVDYPSTQADKQRRLAAVGVSPRDDVAYLGVDLLHDDLNAALAGADHDPRRPSLFICEGLFAYLTLDAGASLCRTLRGRAADGSVLAANFRVVPNTAGPLPRAFRSLVDGVLTAMGEPQKAVFQPGDPEKLLAITGWQPARRVTSKFHRLDEHAHMLAVAAVPA